MSTPHLLRLPATEIRQGDHVIYQIAVDGKLLHSFATVSRISRTPDGDMRGYQRPEALAHIRGIRAYLESDGALLPNAVVVAFDDRIHFDPWDVPNLVGYARQGVLSIPVDQGADDADKPGWIVDGQQRAAAIRDAALTCVPVCVNAFVAPHQVQRTQFALINKVKPLPPGLIDELLPATSGTLPPVYAHRRLPATVMARLNTTPGGPFYRAIKTPTEPEGRIAAASVLKMIEESLLHGALWPYRDRDDSPGDVQAITHHLNVFWALVAAQWPTAWTLPPGKSRLTHGTGIRALGFVMDDVTGQQLDPETIRAVLGRIGDHAAWTQGTWQLHNGQTRPWHDFRYTATDIHILTGHLRHLAGLSR